MTKMKLIKNESKIKEIFSNHTDLDEISSLTNIPKSKLKKFLEKLEILHLFEDKDKKSENLSEKRTKQI